jgi:hypothetical protein
VSFAWDAGLRSTLCCALLAAYAASANAQFKLQQTFEEATALSDASFLTAPSIDAAGSGWLRLTARCAPLAWP